MASLSLKEQKDAMVNLWMTDLSQSPEEKAQQEKEVRLFNR